MRFYANEFEDKKLTCICCGKEFTFKASEQAFYKEKDISEPKRCKECRAKNRENEKGVILTCTGCGEDFLLADGEKKFFEEHNLEIPKRCKKCRSKRRIHDKYYSNSKSS